MGQIVGKGHGISRCKCRIGVAVLTPHWTLGLWDKSQVEASRTAPTSQREPVKSDVMEAGERLMPS